MNWKQVCNQESIRKMETIMYDISVKLHQLDKDIREIRRTTLLDDKSTAWLDFLESSRQQLQSVIKNKDK